MLIISPTSRRVTQPRKSPRSPGCAELHGATEVISTDDVETGRPFVVARRMAIPAVRRKGSCYSGCRRALPALGALVRGIEAIPTDRGVTIAVIAHAGEETRHPLIVFDRTNEDETAEHSSPTGGHGPRHRTRRTITGEHGVGRLKKGLATATSARIALALNHKIKNALDPRHPSTQALSTTAVTSDPTFTVNRSASITSTPENPADTALTASAGSVQRT